MTCVGGLSHDVRGGAELCTSMILFPLQKAFDSGLPVWDNAAEETGQRLDYGNYMVNQSDCPFSAGRRHFQRGLVMRLCSMIVVAVVLLFGCRNDDARRPPLTKENGGRILAEYLEAMEDGQLDKAIDLRCRARLSHDDGENGITFSDGTEGYSQAFLAAFMLKAEVKTVDWEQGQGYMLYAPPDARFFFAVADGLLCLSAYDDLHHFKYDGGSP